MNKKQTNINRDSNRDSFRSDSPRSESPVPDRKRSESPSPGESKRKLKTNMNELKIQNKHEWIENLKQTWMNWKFKTSMNELKIQNKYEWIENSKQTGMNWKFKTNMNRKSTNLNELRILTNKP